MAKRSQFYTVVTSSAGHSLEDITVTVYDVGTLNEATIYSQRSGGSTTPSEFDTGADGRVSFWANPGAYDVTFHDSEIPARISDYTITWDSISGDDAGIDGAKVEDNGLAALQLGTDSVGYDERSAPTLISGTLGDDVDITAGGTWYSGPSITLNQGAGFYLVWGTIEIADDISVNLELEFQFRLLHYGTGVKQTQSERRRIAGTAGASHTFSFFDTITATTNGEVVIAQGTHSVGLVAAIESDRSFIKGFRFA